MGLLTKAQLIDQKEKEKNEHGENMSGNFPKGNGLLEKAEKYGSTEESESEEGEPKGLPERAETFQGDRDEKGLLEKAVSFRGDAGDPAEYTGKEQLLGIDSSGAAYEPKRGLLRQAAMILAGEEKQMPGAEGEEKADRPGAQEDLIEEDAGVVSREIEETAEAAIAEDIHPDEILLEEGVLTKDMLEGEEELFLEEETELKEEPAESEEKTIKRGLAATREKAEDAAASKGKIEETLNGQRGGLLEQASLVREKARKSEEAELTGEAALTVEEPPAEQRGGLLEQAILIRETEEAAILASAEKKKGGPAEKTGADDFPSISIDDTAERSDAQVLSKQAGDRAPVYEGAQEEKTAEILPTPVPALIEQCLTEGYTQRVISLFNDICGQDGYLTLCEAVAGTMARLGKGKTCMLFLYKHGRYTAECIYPEGSLDKKTGKVGFGKSSQLIRSLENNTGQPVRSASIKDESIMKEIKKLDNILPWTAYPLPSADGIAGLIIVGGQSKRPRVDNRVTGLFSHLAGLYISSYVQERESQKELEKLKAEKAEKESVIDMYSNSDRFLGTERDNILKEAMKNLYTSLEIESAALVTGWGSPGKLLVEDSIGIPKNILGKYRVSKTDKKIKTVIEAREPAVLSDAAKRITKLSKKNDDQLKTFIVAPVLFCDEVLGILNIHRMKGAGKKLTKSVKSRIQHGAFSIAGFILYSKLMNANPWNILSSFLSEETGKAKRTRKPLNLAMFTMENGKKVLGSHGFSRYWGFAEKLHRIIDRNVQGKGVYRVVDWNKTVVSLREMEKSEANALIRQIKKEFNESFKGPKKERIVNITSSATVFPEESKDLTAILAAIF